MRAWTRLRAVWITGAVLGLLGVAALVVAFVDLGRYREQLEATLAERLRRDVAIGSLHVSLWPLGVRAVDSVIAEDPAFDTGQPFVRVEDIYVSVSPLALLRGRIDVRAVELREPAIELVRNAGGTWNVASLGRGSAPSSRLVLRRVVVSGGQLAITTPGADGTRRTIYPEIDLTLGDYAADRPFRVTGSAPLQRVRSKLSVRGEGGPIAGRSPGQALFAGDVEFDGAVSGKGSVTVTTEEAVLDDISLATGATKAEGRLTVRNFAAPEVEFELSADTIDVVELQRLLAPAEGEATAEAPAPTSDGGTRALLLRATGGGTLSAGTIRYDELLLENARAEVQLKRGVVTLQPLTASLFGGTHQGSVIVDAREAAISVTVDSRLEQVDANRLVSATTSLDDTLEGTLDASNQLAFSADGDGSLAPSLNGTLSVSIPEGRIAHMDLMHAVRSVAGFPGDDQDRQTTTLRDVRARFSVTDGIAKTEDLSATFDGDSTIAGSGTIDLTNQTLDLRVTAVLSRRFGDRVGGRAVTAVLGTVLANDNGELVVPMLVTGTTREPRFAPDLKRIAELKLGEKLPESPLEGIRDALRRIRRGQGDDPPSEER